MNHSTDVQATDALSLIHQALETKGEPQPAFAAMADLLERMRRELDDQFRDFSTLRDHAAQRAQSELPDAEAKLARADLKAAVESLSVIVRTLEKVDQLQRQLTRDQAELEALPETREAYDALFAELDRLIEARVEERLGRQGAPDDPSAPP